MELLQSVKQFSKEISALEAIIYYAKVEQTSNDLRKLCREIGITLRILEGGTLWTNKAELCIGLIN